MRVSKAAVAGSAALVFFAGCTTPMARPPAARTSFGNQDVEAQLFKLQKDSARILSAIENLQRDSQDPNQACAEAVTRITELERTVLALEEHMLDAQRRLDQTMAEVRRLMQMQRPKYAASLPAPPEAEQPPDDPLAIPGNEESAVVPPGEAVPPPSARELFTAAYSDFSRGQLEVALAGFEAALKADADGPLADDAQFWVGETLYSLGRPEDAIRAMDYLIAAYPESEKIPAAHLKKGLALFQARQASRAVQELDYVIETWPDSAEAKIAEEYLRRKNIDSQ